MGGELPTIPIVPQEPTVSEWVSFMEAIAGADTNAIISMVIQDATGNPSVADFRVPSGWVKISPRFSVNPPVITPPNTQPAVQPAMVTSAVKFRAAGELAGRELAVLRPGDVGLVIWLFNGVTRLSDKLTWQFVKVVTPKWTDYGWIAADYVKVQENSG